MTTLFVPNSFISKLINLQYSSFTLPRPSSSQGQPQSYPSILPIILQTSCKLLSSQQQRISSPFSFSSLSYFSASKRISSAAVLISSDLLETAFSFSSNPSLFHLHHQPTSTYPSNRCQSKLASRATSFRLVIIAFFSTSFIGLWNLVSASIAYAAPFASMSVITNTVTTTATKPAIIFKQRAQSPQLAFLFGLTEHITFYLSEFLTWNPFSKVVGLILITALIIVMGGFIFKAVDPEAVEAKSPFWKSFRAIANPLEDDWEMNRLRLVSAFLSTLGMIFFAILVGMVTESVNSAIQHLNAGRSKLILKDHYIFCGWNRQLPSIIKGMDIPDGKRIIILANQPQDSIIEQLRESFTEKEREKFKISYRTGGVVLEEDLRMVAASHASKIVLVRNESIPDKSAQDRSILGEAVALNQNLPNFKGDIIAQINSVRDGEVLVSVLRESNAKSAVAVSSEVLLGNFLAQAVNQPGLSDLITTMMGADPTKVFHIKKVKEIAPSLRGVPLNSLSPASIPDCILCGFIDEKSGDIHLGLNHGILLDEATELILVGTPQRLVKPVLPAIKLDESAIVLSTPAKKTPLQNFLLCGWRDEIANFITQVDETVQKGSTVTILTNQTDSCKVQVDAIKTSLHNLKVSIKEGSADDAETLFSTFKETQFHNLVLLSEENAVYSSNIFETDCRNLAILVNLRDMIRREGLRGSDFHITVEFLSDRVASLARGHGIANIIMPQSVGPRIASQAIRDHRLGKLWSQVLSQEGREIYLRPVSRYIEPNNSASFAEVAALASKNYDEIVFGYVKGSDVALLNPKDEKRWESVNWTLGDYLIVFSNHQQ